MTFRATGEWAKLDRLARAGKAPRIVVDSTPIPASQIPGAKRPPEERYRKYLNHRTRTMNPEAGPYCFRAGCGRRLQKDRAGFCSDRCKEIMRAKAELVLELINNPPEVVYVEQWRDARVGWRFDATVVEGGGQRPRAVLLRRGDQAGSLGISTGGANGRSRSTVTRARDRAVDRTGAVAGGAVTRFRLPQATGGTPGGDAVGGADVQATA